MQQPDAKSAIVDWERVSEGGDAHRRHGVGQQRHRASDRRYLGKPEAGYHEFTPGRADALAATLRPGDVLLIEGNSHIAGVIKYLTQSTWSHAALYTGPIGDRVLPVG